MTTSNGRSGEGRRAQRSAGQWLIGLLIVLALAASVLMVINDDMSLAGSLAVIAALWAAVIAAILVTKFRRQAEGAEAKSRDLRLVYELQLEREIAARASTSSTSSPPSAARSPTRPITNWSI